MNAKRVLTFGVAFFLALFAAAAMDEAMAQRHIQIAEIDVDPPQVESYKAAVQEQIEAAIRLEPGVLVLYSVSTKDNPAHVTVFEIYRDREAYLAHLQAPHFLKYKTTVEKMVKSLKLIPVDPVMLGAKPNSRRPLDACLSAPVAQRIHDETERRGGLAAAWIEEVIARIRLAPVGEHALQTPLREMRFRHLLWDEGKTKPRQRSGQHLVGAIAGHLPFDAGLQLASAFLEFHA
jgi:quinol monooxygenase YgiN